MSKVSVVICLAQKFESNPKSILCHWVPNLGSGMTLLIAPTWKGRKCTVTGEKRHQQTATRRHIRSKKEVCMRGNKQRERDMESGYPFRDGLTYTCEVVPATIFSL